MTGPQDEGGGAVRIPITGTLDLHPFAPREIPSLVEEYLGECREAGILEVRLIHGKGKGFQRMAVRKVLESLPFVDSWRTPPEEAGGWGATLVLLRPKGRPGRPP